MTQAAEQVYDMATRLTPADRAELIDRLYELDDAAGGATEPGYNEAWAAEIRERVAEMDGGDVTPIPWEEVRAGFGRKGDDAAG